MSAPALIVWGSILALNSNGTLLEGNTSLLAAQAFASLKECNEQASEAIAQVEKEAPPGMKFAIVCVDITSLPVHSVTQSPVQSR